MSKKITISEFNEQFTQLWKELENEDVIDYVNIILVNESKHSEVTIYDLNTGIHEIENNLDQLDLVYINLTLTDEFCNFCTEEYLYSDFIQGLINVLESLQYICNLGYTSEYLII